jgi:hypothetical protein
LAANLPERRITMLKLKSLTLALGAIALASTAMSATAGSWPTIPAKGVAKVSAGVPATTRIAKQEPGVARDTLSSGDFEQVSSEAGWQLRQHQLVPGGGVIVHAPQCVLAANAAVALPAVASKPYLPAGDGSPGA